MLPQLLNNNKKQFDTKKKPILKKIKEDRDLGYSNFPKVGLRALEVIFSFFKYLSKQKIPVRWWRGMEGVVLERLENCKYRLKGWDGGNNISILKTN